MTGDSAQEPPGPPPPHPEAIEAFCDYLNLLEVGEEVDWEAFCGDRPDHAGELRQLLAEYERVTAILDRLAPAASFSARLRAHYGDSVDPGISLDGEEPRLSTTTHKGGTTGGTGRVLSRLSAQSPESTRYEAKREIARGGMGAIIEVWDGELRRTLAMKVVLTSRQPSSDDSDSEGLLERRLSRFLEEAQITGQLDHPGIVPVHDIGIDGQGRVYFTMQLIDGLDLRRVFELARLQKDGWTEKRVVSVMIRVCEAMAFAHSKGVVHRDLKPANIMVGRFGEAYVMDWGLAKVLGREDAHDIRIAEEKKQEESRRVKTDRSDSDTGTDAALKTMDGDVVGTPAYMAPEQARGKLEEISLQSDVYSMGAMLYHLLSGHMPYEPLGEKVPAHTILEAVRNAPPWPLRQLNPDVDSELGAICEKAMSREAPQRYGDMMALAGDLTAWVEGRGVGAYTTGVLYETRKWIARNKTASSALGALLGLILLSISLFIWQQQRNLGKVEEEKTQTEEARAEAEKAQEEAIANFEAAQKSEKEKEEEADRALRESVKAREAADRAAKAATDAHEQTQLALAAAYRLSVTAASYSLRLDDVPEAKKNLTDCAVDLRGWEWRHLRLSAEGSLGDSVVQGKGVSDLAVTADGDTLLTYGFGLPLRLWSVSERRMIKGLTGAGFLDFENAGRLELLRCALSPDGSLLLMTYFLDNSLRVFGRNGVKQYDFKGHTAPIIDAAFSQDGTKIVTASEDGRALLFDTTTSRISSELLGHQGAVTCAALDRDGMRVATGGEDRTVRIWDAATGEEERLLEGHHTASLSAIDWSEDGELLVTASLDGTLAVWRVSDGALQAVMHGHLGPIRDAVFGRGGESVFSASDDLTVRMWDSGTGRQRRVFRGHDKAVRSVVRLGTENRIASGSLDGTVRIWDGDWDPAVTLIEEERTFSHVAFSGDGTGLCATPGEGRCAMIDSDSGVVERLLGENPQVGRRRYVASSASADGRFLALSTDQNVVEIWNRTTGKRVRILRGFPRDVVFLDLSADGRTIAMAGAGKRAHVEDLDNEGSRVSIDLPHTLASLAISPDGLTLATAGSDESLRLWNTRTREPGPAKREIHGSMINDLEFSADGRLLATASNDRTARIFAVEELEPLLSCAGHTETIGCVAFSPTENRLVTGAKDGTLRLWSTQRAVERVAMESAGENRSAREASEPVPMAEPMLLLLGHEGEVLDVAFSPDGSRIASCGADTGVRIWETLRAEERYERRTWKYSAHRIARQLVEDLYGDLHSTELVESALTDDAGLEAGLREAALTELGRMIDRGDLDPPAGDGR